ncbi:hypothetical protein HHU10_22175 [Tsukamurella columbiensis]|uniref:CAAX prenyl protease 2/Lysostaphin resistance protein A-like domain-containing protein n=1 Tax=Tsukamurella columbiensis TaxID=128509 RepID=A0ABX1LLY4_9ACTN|nr:hypothetical protein [Tsukamurella columbiensis]
MCDAYTLYVWSGASPAGWSPSTGIDWSNLAFVAVTGTGSLAAGIIVTRTMPAPPADRCPSPIAWRRSWPRVWRTAVVYLAVMSTVAVFARSYILAPLLREHAPSTMPALSDTPLSTGPVRIAEVFQIAIYGGPFEEPVFVVLPLLGASLVALFLNQYGPAAIAARFLTYAVPAIVIVSMVGRTGIHLYQGADAAIAAAVWGAAACLLYLRWRSLGGLVLAHVTYNVIYVDVLRRIGSVALLTATTGVLVLGAAALGVYVLREHHRTTLTRPSLVDESK